MFLLFTYNHQHLAATARPELESVPCTPEHWASFRLATSPGLPTNQLCFLLSLHFHLDANKHHPETAECA